MRCIWASCLMYYSLITKENNILIIGKFVAIVSLNDFTRRIELIFNQRHKILHNQHNIIFKLNQINLGASSEIIDDSNKETHVFISFVTDRPQVSICNSSKGLTDFEWITGKGSLCCFA